MYNYDWEQLNTWSDPIGGKYPTTGVTISATGRFVVRVGSSVGGGLNLPGFSLNASTSFEDIYYSDFMTIRYTYNLYQ